MKVFFYGLFMDESLLAEKGIEPTEVKRGYVEDFGLMIGERATLVRKQGSRAYGVMMEIAPKEVAKLYAEASVADYQPEPVVVELTDRTQVEATCYNLPSDKITGANRVYAESLLEVATRLEFPIKYLDQIRNAQIGLGER